MPFIELTVDGETVRVEQGASALDAVLGSGRYLPHLCKDPDRPRLGTCRTCLVAIDGFRGPQAACAIPAAQGMAIRTGDPDVRRVRTGVIQLTVDMLPAGDISLTGELAVAAAAHGVVAGRFRTRTLARRERLDETNPFWSFDHRRCILCERCVDACQEVQHIGAIAMLGRDFTAAIGTFRDGPIGESTCTSCGQCWAACPTHAIRLRKPVSGD